MFSLQSLGFGVDLRITGPTGMVEDETFSSLDTTHSLKIRFFCCRRPFWGGGGAWGFYWVMVRSELYIYTRYMQPTRRDPS